MIKEHLKRSFWSKVNKQKNGCWLYTGALSSRGYGVYSVAEPRKTFAAHRLALALHLGRSIKEGMHVLHSCDTPRCINPKHLREGTHSDNMRDMHSRGRYPTRHANRWLSDDEIREIRKRYKPYFHSQFMLAAYYDVSRSVIQGILNGTKYKDVA